MVNKPKKNKLILILAAIVIILLVINSQEPTGRKTASSGYSSFSVSQYGSTGKCYSVSGSIRPAGVCTGDTICSTNYGDQKILPDGEFEFKSQGTWPCYINGNEGCCSHNVDRCEVWGPSLNVIAYPKGTNVSSVCDDLNYCINSTDCSSGMKCVKNKCVDENIQCQIFEIPTRELCWNKNEAICINRSIEGQVGAQFSVLTIENNVYYLMSTYTKSEKIFNEFCKSEKSFSLSELIDKGYWPKDYQSMGRDFFIQYPESTQESNQTESNQTNNCISDILINCSDGSTLVFYKCINGELKDTGNKCSIPLPPINQCTIKEYSLNPKCDASVWNDYPKCEWDDSDCKSPNYWLITIIAAILVGTLIFVFIRKKIKK